MPTNYPSAWGKVSLGELISTIRNGTTSQQMDYMTPFPVTRIETISNGLINFSRVKYLARPEPAYLLKKNDILYSHINSIKHMGKVALYDGMSPLYHGMNLMLLRPNEGKVHPKFLFVYLSSEFGRAHARKECKSSINQASLGQGDIKNLKIHLPSLSEQRSIAEILDTIDEAIQKTEALISKLKAMKQGLLYDLLTHGLDKNGKLRDPKAHPEQFKDSPLGRIPKEWMIQELGKAAPKIQDGTHFSPKTTSGPFRYLTSKNIRFGHVDLSGCGWISEKEHEAIYSRCDVRYGDVLLTKDGANTGNAAINNLNEPVSLLSSVAFIRCDDRTLHSEYVFHYLLSPGCQQRIKDLMSGNAITRLTLERIKSFVIPVPDIKEQLKIIEPLNSHDARIRAEEQYRDKLKLQKKGLMHDLLTGKVRVQSNDNIAC